MYKVSDLLGKPLLSIGDAKIVGTISNMLFDEKLQKATFITLFDADDEIIYLPVNKLLNVDGDVAVTFCASETVSEAYGFCPVNRAAFSENGKSLGTIKDVIMDGTKVVSLQADVSLLPLNVLNCSEVIIFNTGDKQIRIKKPKKDVKQTPYKNAKIELPSKNVFTASYDFLIGKKLQRSVAAANGKIIAKEGESITNELISTAKREGKLVVLALNAL